MGKEARSAHADVLCVSRGDLTLEERDHVLADIVREITALWQTDELRRRKPTPVDGETFVLACMIHTQGIIDRSCGACTSFAQVASK